MNIKLAKGWQEVELTEAALKAQMKALASSNPLMVATMQQWLDTGAFKAMKFYALGYSGTRVVGNINVNALPLGGDVPLDAVQPAIEGEFKQLGATGIKFRHATVAGATSLIVDYKLTMKTASGSLAMTGRAYLVPHGDVVYDATFTCYGTSTATCLAAADGMAKSMTITP